jgi:hypothetical protein
MRAERTTKQYWIQDRNDRVCFNVDVGSQASWICHCLQGRTSFSRHSTQPDGAPVFSSSLATRGQSYVRLPWPPIARKRSVYLRKLAIGPLGQGRVSTVSAFRRVPSTPTTRRRLESETLPILWLWVGAIWSAGNINYLDLSVLVSINGCRGWVEHLRYYGGISLSRLD